MVSKFLLLLSVFFCAFSSEATSIQGMSFKQLSQNAELVFEGEVLNVESKWQANNLSIITLVTFEVKDVVLGEWSEGSLTLEFLGGTVDGQTMKVQALVYPQIGEHGVYFVESTRQKMVNPLLGWTQGHFKIKNGEMATSSNQMLSSVSAGQDLPLGKLSEGQASGIRTKLQQSQAGVSLAEFKTAILSAKD